MRQTAFTRPGVCLWVVALKSVQVLDDVVSGDVAPAGDVHFVTEDGGRMVHPPLLQVGTPNELVGLGVVRHHSAGVACDSRHISVTAVAPGALAATLPLRKQVRITKSAVFCQPKWLLFS